jgi:biopolymer transport protein ExbB
MFFIDQLRGIYELGGPVVALLILVSVITLAVVLYKIWQFKQARVGYHTVIRQALAQWDRGEAKTAERTLRSSKSYLAPIVTNTLLCVDKENMPIRMEAEAETQFLKLERGFRFLDMVAQLAPLLGLFGTVLGMIEAFQALQDAGSSVDPSLLAGGIWVALLTTAVGLAVAMPTSVVLSWFEAKMTDERVFAELALTTIQAPVGKQLANAA